MSVNLVAAGWGTANPGTFFGRAGPGPDGAITAAHAVAGALAGLEPDPDTPLTACLEPLARVHACIRVLADVLTLEARIAPGALTVDLRLPPPDAAQEVRARLKAAARSTLVAADQVYASCRALNREVESELERRSQFDPPDSGRLVRRARAAADRMANLKDELTRAAARITPASLPMVAGHGQVTEAAGLILAHLWRVCGQFDSGITGACARRSRATAARPDRITGPLHQAPADLRRAARDVTRARSVLADATTQIRKAPPGFPCAGCTGTGTKWGAPCNRCRGSGTDPYAMRQ